MIMICRGKYDKDGVANFVSATVEYFFLKNFHPKIKSVQNGLKCKKTHKKLSLLFNFYHWPGLESNGPGPESMLDGLVQPELLQFPQNLEHFWDDFSVFPEFGTKSQNLG